MRLSFLKKMVQMGTAFQKLIADLRPTDYERMQCIQ